MLVQANQRRVALDAFAMYGFHIRQSLRNALSTRAQTVLNVDRD